MSEEAIIQACACAIATEQWWKPLLGFMCTNCNKFTDDSKNTNEEYQCFLDYRVLLVELFDSFVARQIGVRPAQLESAMIQTQLQKNRQCLAIIDILKNMTNFETFKKQMIQQSAKIDEEVTNLMLNFHMQQHQQQPGEETDVADLLEKGEQMALQAQTAQMVENIKTVLNVPTSGPPQCPTPRPTDRKPTFTNNTIVQKIPINSIFKQDPNPTSSNRCSSPCLSSRPMILKPTIAGRK